MNLVKKILCLTLLTVSACVLMSNLAKANVASDPVAMLKSISDQLVAKLKENKASLKKSPSLVYSLATNIVVPHADMDVMAMKVLPPQAWSQATADQKAKFKAEFTTLLVRTYATALADFNDQTVRFMPVRGGYQGKNNIQVLSKIDRTDGPSISVNYRLILKGSEWKLYDLIVEGVSLIESFHSQFAEQLSKGDMNKVIKDLAAHNVEYSGN